MRLVLSSDQSKFLNPSAELGTLKTAERLKGALKKFSLFSLIAVVSVFVPVLHFFLVPLFLLIAVVLGMRAYSNQYLFKFKQSCTCLQCHQPMKAEFLLDKDLRVKCDNCFVHYLVDIQST